MESRAKLFGHPIHQEQTASVVASVSGGTIVLAYDHPQLPYRTEV